MNNWFRFSSYGTVTVMWLLSTLGITWAQSENHEAREAAINASTPVYLLPHQVYASGIEGFNQPSMEQYTHYSHRSHSSHYSHSSHTSHYSGYTSSGPSDPTYSPSGNSYADVMDIASVQRKLNDLGYDAGTADGIKGERTIAAIKRFQSDYALDSDGVVGAKTKQSLDAISLMDVQRKLKGLGYTCEANGSRDDNTVKAIKDFQQQKGLEANGLINKQTKDALAL